MLFFSNYKLIFFIFKIYQREKYFWHFFVKLFLRYLQLKGRGTVAIQSVSMTIESHRHFNVIRSFFCTRRRIASIILCRLAGFANFRRGHTPRIAKGDTWVHTTGSRKPPAKAHLSKCFFWNEDAAKTIRNPHEIFAPPAPCNPTVSTMHSQNPNTPFEESGRAPQLKNVEQWDATFVQQKPVALNRNKESLQ